MLQIKFIEAIQFGLFAEGRDLTDDEAYRHLLPLFGIEAEEFYAKLKDEKYLTQVNQSLKPVNNFKYMVFQHCMYNIPTEKFLQLQVDIQMRKILKQGSR